MSQTRIYGALDRIATNLERLVDLLERVEAREHGECRHRYRYYPEINAYVCEHCDREEPI